MESQSEIIDKEIIQVVRGCEAEGGEWLNKILEIQFKLNSWCCPSRRNNLFVTVLGFDPKLGLHTIPYAINKYQSAIERHNIASQALTNAKASQVKEANLQRIPELQYKVGDKVLVSTVNIHIQKTSLKMKPLEIGLFTI